MKFIALCFAFIVSAIVAPAHTTEADQTSFSSVVLWAYGFDEKAAISWRQQRLFCSNNHLCLGDGRD